MTPRVPVGPLFSLTWLLMGLAPLAYVYQMVYVIFPPEAHHHHHSMIQYWDSLPAQGAEIGWPRALTVLIITGELAVSFSFCQFILHVLMIWASRHGLIYRWPLLFGWLFQLLRSISLVVLFLIINLLAGHGPEGWPAFSLQWPIAVVTLLMVAAEFSGMLTLLMSYDLSWKTIPPPGGYTSL